MTELLYGRAGGTDGLLVEALGGAPRLGELVPQTDVCVGAGVVELELVIPDEFDAAALWQTLQLSQRITTFPIKSGSTARQKEALRHHSEHAGFAKLPDGARVEDIASLAPLPNAEVAGRVLFANVRRRL